MITNGSTVISLRDDKSPLQSPNTRLVAAALAVGFQFAGDKSFMDATDEAGKRTVTWLMDAALKVPFKWVEDDKAKHEDITFGEFRKRYTDMEWVRSNPDHPIAYLRAVHKKHVNLVGRIKELPTCATIKHGKKTASIPSNATPEEREWVLGELRK